MFSKCDQKQHNFIWKALVLQSSFSLSQSAKILCQKVTQYLLGTRNSYNIFHYDKLLHLLLKITPTIKTLFADSSRRSPKFGRVVAYVPPTPPKNPAKLKAWQKKMKHKLMLRFKKTKHYYKTLVNPHPVKVLFATTNPIYAHIIESAADLCNMPFHTQRWLCGYLTANAKYLSTSKKNLNKGLRKVVHVETLVHQHYFKNFSRNKEVPEKRHAWHGFQKISHRPTVVIIPDIQNNDMILRETKILNLPVIGLVNSDCPIEITYPIFGNANSIEIVQFFCYFLATLIAKEVVKQGYNNRNHRILAKTRWLLRKKFEILRKYQEPILAPKRFNLVPSVAKRSLSLGRNFNNKIKRAKPKLLKRQQTFAQHLGWKFDNKIKKKFKKGVKLARKNWLDFNKRKPVHLIRRLGRLADFVNNDSFFRNKCRRHLNYKKKRPKKIRKRINKIKGQRQFLKKNLRLQFFESVYRDKFLPKRFWVKRIWKKYGRLKNLYLVRAIIGNMFFLLKSGKLSKRQCLNLLTTHRALSYLLQEFVEKSMDPLFKAAPNRFLFDSFNEKTKTVGFNLKFLCTETLVTNDSLWKNAYWTYFRAQKKKNRLKARWHFRKSKRKFRGKLIFARKNKVYYWRSTLLLLNKGRIQQQLRLFKQTQKFFFKRQFRYYWKRMTWFYHRKLRRRFWVVRRLRRLFYSKQANALFARKWVAARHLCKSKRRRKQLADQPNKKKFGDNFKQKY